MTIRCNDGYLSGIINQLDENTSHEVAMKSIDDLLVCVRECLPKNVTIVVQDEQQRICVRTRLADEFKTPIFSVLDDYGDMFYRITKTKDLIVLTFKDSDQPITYVLTLIEKYHRYNVVFIVDNIDGYFGQNHTFNTHIIRWSPETSDVIVAPSQHKCPLCKDTGTRHFEFYDRTCECQL